MTSSQRRNRNRKLFRKPRSINLEQLENRMMCTISGLEQSLQLLHAPTSAPALNAPTANTAPTLTTPINSLGNTTITTVSKSIPLSAVATDDGGTKKLTYTWQVVQAPTDATVKFSKNGNNAAQNTLLNDNRVF